MQHSRTAVAPTWQLLISHCRAKTGYMAAYDQNTAAAVFFSLFLRAKPAMIEHKEQQMCWVQASSSPETSTDGN
jgi:hypothetical protein